MTTLRRVSLPLIASLALSTPLAIPLAHAQDAALPAGHTRLSVSAEGSATRAPDIARFSAGVTSTGHTAAEAMGANAQAMDRVVSALKGAGIPARDIQTSRIALNPVFASDTNGQHEPRITGYRASNSVNVRQRDLAATGKVIDALVAAGANEVNGPDFGVDAPEPALDEARAAAVKAARSRAELYARAAGLRVVGILAISEEGDSMPRPMMAMARVAAAPMASTPVEAGDLALSARVSVVFDLAPQ